MTQDTTPWPAVRLTRWIPAPTERVYRAWLDGELLARWMAPTDWSVIRVEVDERVGGHLSIWQRDPSGGEGGFEAELLELVPGERIVFRWGFAGPEHADGPVYDSRLTISLRPVGEGATELTLLHEQLDQLQRGLPGVAGLIPVGWEQALDKLPAALAAGEVRS